MNSGNIVFKVSGLNDLPQHELLSIIQPPYPVQVVRTDGTPLDASIPKQIVPHARWMEWAEEDGQDIRLIDWDQAFKHGMEPGRLAQPVESKAPETMLSDHFDYRVDLWRAGCIVRTAEIDPIVSYTYPNTDIRADIRKPSFSSRGRLCAHRADDRFCREPATRVDATLGTDPRVFDTPIKYSTSLFRR